MSSRTIRILLLGDESVGKSTFISSLIGEKLPKYEKCFQPVVLPPSMCHGINNIYTQLMDTNTRNTRNIEEQILRADLILLFYDVNDQETVVRLLSFWMPLISKVRDKVPIVVVGNKLDKRDDKKSRGFYVTIKDVLKPIIRKFRQVEVGLQCSALAGRGVTSVLSCAQRTILYPLSPLFDLSAKDLTVNFKRALVRIFRILDKDCDGNLCDKEILQLQNRVFDSNMQDQDLHRLKELIQVELQQQELSEINLQGFFTLNKKCIEMMAIHICWSILRYFGYNDQLKLPPITDRLEFSEESGASVQLKEKPIFFLKKLYQSCSKGFQKQKTAQKLIDVIFFPINGEVPIGQFVRSKQPIQLSDFIFAWHYFAYSNYLKCFKALRDIGYEGSLSTAFLIRPEKISLRDMGLIHYRSIVSIGIFDSGGAQTKYIDGLFSKFVDDFSIRRSHYIYSLSNSSKIIYLFRLNRDNIEKFFYHRSRMLDMFVFFDTDMNSSKNCKFLDMVPEWIIIKRISGKEAEVLGIVDSQLERPKKCDYNRLFDLIWVMLKNPSLGYSEQTLARLRMLNQKTLFEPRNLAIMGVFAMALALCGHFMIKKKRQ